MALSEVTWSPQSICFAPAWPSDGHSTRSPMRFTCRALNSCDPSTRRSVTGRLKTACQLIAASGASSQTVLTDEERAAIEDGQTALNSLLNKLADIPSPAGPTPRQLAATLEDTTQTNVKPRKQSMYEPACVGCSVWCGQSDGLRVGRRRRSRGMRGGGERVVGTAGGGAGLGGPHSLWSQDGRVDGTHEGRRQAPVAPCPLRLGVGGLLP